MKSKLVGTTRLTKLFDKAFLKGMGSSVDLLSRVTIFPTPGVT